MGKHIRNSTHKSKHTPIHHLKSIKAPKIKSIRLSRKLYKSIKAPRISREILDHPSSLKTLKLLADIIIKLDTYVLDTHRTEQRDMLHITILDINEHIKDQLTIALGEVNEKNRVNTVNELDPVEYFNDLIKFIKDTYYTFNTNAQAAFNNHLKDINEYIYNKLILFKQSLKPSTSSKSSKPSKPSNANVNNLANMFGASTSIEEDPLIDMLSKLGI